MQSKAQIDQLLRQTSDAKEIPGVVAIAATGKDVLYQGAFGKRDLSKPDPMTADSVFWIASMTKAVTSAGAMQLVEQGKLSLDEPIGKLLPDLAAPQVLEGFDASGAPKLRPAKTPITLRQLMTHTAGFCYDMWNGDMATYLEKTGTPGIMIFRGSHQTDWRLLMAASVLAVVPVALGFVYLQRFLVEGLAAGAVKG